MEKNGVHEVSLTKVAVKREEDIKAFAETTMNELLGWYGYDSKRADSKLSKKCRSYSESNESEGESLKFSDGCGWCGKPVDENNGLISASAVFCSELCFSQSRRANFKRNKTCDWCRHVRHTVSYVDFQDGASQLQFCSDKCLNQYKMHIFCRETRAHLELHPHLHGEEGTSGNLITPDLWLRNCKSPLQRSPSPSPRPACVSSKSADVSPIPLIAVAPSSKLLPVDVHKKTRSRVQKKFRKRCPSTVTSLGNCVSIFNDSPQDLRIRHTPPAEDSESIEYNYLPKKEPVRVQEDTDTPNKPVEDHGSSQVKIPPSYVKALLGSLLPPPTTFVPYPVILPLPIPIPIPIPIPKMFKSNNGKDLIEVKDCFSQTEVWNNINNNNDVCEQVKKDEEDKTESEAPASRRPLRSRKRAAEAKSRLFVKHKKTLSSVP